MTTTDADRERAWKIATEYFGHPAPELADDIAEALAAMRAEALEQAAEIAEATLGWSPAGDKRAAHIAHDIRALIATPAETEKT